MANVSACEQNEYSSDADLSVRCTDKNTHRLNIRIAIEQNEQFIQACRILGKTRTQVVMAAVSATIKEARTRVSHDLAQQPAEFEMLTFQQAREWLAPYYAGKPPSFDTLERRIADGILIATKESDARTGRRRILKSSLVAWMRRLGKQLHEEMM